MIWWWRNNTLVIPVKAILLVIPLLVTALHTAQSQQQDLHAWYNVTVAGELSKKVGFSIEPELRLFENLSRIRSWQTELNMYYQLAKKVDVGGIYRYQVEYDNPSHNKRIHRWALYTKFGYKTGHFRWRYRAMIQSEYRNILTSDDGMVNDLGHRHKLSVKYTRKKLFIQPSLGVEYYFVLGPATDKGEWKRRFFISCEHKISKRISTKIAYKHQSEYQVKTPETIHIMVMSLEYKPKFLK